MNESIMTGIAQGIDQGVRNFINIKNAMSQERERKEQSDIDFKIKKLKLKQVENELSPEQLALATEKLKVENAASKSANALNMIKIKAAKEDIKNDLLSRTQFLKMMQENKPMEPGTAMSFGGLKIAGPKQKDETNEGLDFVNDLRSGGGSDNDLIEEYNTTKDKNRVRQIEDILTKKGYNFE